MANRKRVSASQPTLAAPPTCIIHPTTGQLMAPGSKFWPYVFDHKKFGRDWFGLKATYPGEPVNPKTSITAKMGGREPVKRPVEASEEDLTTVPIPTGSAAITTTREINQIEPSNKPITQPLPRGRRRGRKSRKDDIDAQYNDLIERQANLRQSGKIEESHVITAAINVGMMSGWDNADVPNVVERLEKAIANGKKEKLSSRMMEVVGEMERFGFRGQLKDLREIREHYKGEFYDGANADEAREGKSKWRAPGLLMLMQAGINVAFLKVLGCAEEGEDEYFDEGVFDDKAALFFKVPNKVCAEERKYLRGMSRLGTQESQDKKISACPGIERALKEEEKRNILEKVRDEVDGGADIITIVAGLFRKLDMESNDTEEYAMEILADDGFLVLEHVYRKKIEAPILIGDGMIDGEEDEDDQDDEDEEEEQVAEDPVKEVAVRSRRGKRRSAAGNDAEETEEAEEGDNERTSLVVTLRYRKR